MPPTIIFISGWKVPKWIAKTKFIWDESFWSNYNCIFLDSKTPTSDNMISKELDDLQDLVESYPDCALVAQSLGGWWAANLALRSSVSIRKLVLWTPVCDASAYPIFKASRLYHPPFRPLCKTNGPHRVLTFAAKNDLITPSDGHAYDLSNHFNSITYTLNGGHAFQWNHKAALKYMKDWIET